MLVITNGSSAGRLVSIVHPKATVLTWDDVLHDGPVPYSNVNELQADRTGFLADSGFGNVDEIAESFRKRNDLLGRYREFDEVCLFFEHDLYDQLQLAELLHYFASEPVSQTSLTMSVQAVYIGEQSPEPVAELLEDRHPVTDNALTDGSVFWRSFTSGDHAGLESFGSEELQFLEDAARRLLQEYPSQKNGLARSRHQIIECLSSGPLDPVTLFKNCATMEEARYLGDASFWKYVIELERCANPLLQISPNGFSLPGVSPDFKKQQISLTDTGHMVLAGELDHVNINGVDRWIGGVHLTMDNCARWDDDAGQLIHRH